MDVPHDKSNVTDFVDLYTKLVEHTLDPLEPFVFPEDKKKAPIRVPMGRSKNASNYQDVPLKCRIL